MLKKIVSTFSSNVVIAVLNLIVAVAVSQYLGAAGKGQQSILITTIALVLLVCNIAGGASLVYLVPRYDNFKILLPAYFWSFIVCVVVYFVSGMSGDIPVYMKFHISLLTLISSLTAVNTTILLGHERINSRNLIALLQTALLVCLLLYFFEVAAYRDISAFVTALYIAYTVAFALSCVFVAKHLNKGTQAAVKYRFVVREMFRYGFLNQLSHITQMLSFRVSYYLLLLYLGEGSVGIYSNAVALTESVWLISKSIATVQYARIANTTDDTYARTLTMKLLKPSLFISLLLLVPMALLPAVFYTTLFGAEFSRVNVVIAVMAPGVLVYNISLITGHYFSGRGRYHINTLASLAGLAVTLLMCFLLIPLWGIYGAALAAVLSFSCTSFIVLYVFKRETGAAYSDFFPGRKDLINYWGTFRNLLKTGTLVIHE